MPSSDRFFGTARRLVDELADLGRDYDIVPLLSVLVVRLAEGHDRYRAAYTVLLQTILEKIVLPEAVVRACIRALLEPQVAAAASTGAHVLPPLSDTASAALQTLQHKYAVSLDHALAELLHTDNGDAGPDGDGERDEAAPSPLFDVLSSLFQVRWAPAAQKARRCRRWPTHRIGRMRCALDRFRRPNVAGCVCRGRVTNRWRTPAQPCTWRPSTRTPSCVWPRSANCWRCLMPPKRYGTVGDGGRPVPG